MIGPLFDTFTGAMFIFSSARFLNMCKPRTSCPTSFGILWKLANKLMELARDGKCRLTRFDTIRNFLANEIYHFSRLSHQTGCLFTWAVYSILSAPYSFTFACSRMLFCKNCWRYGFKILNHFYQNVVFIGCNIFSLVLVISLSWYWHLTLSHEFLTFMSFNVWR